MGLDLPSGGHLTHGYYTAKQLGAVMHRCERKAPRSTRQEEDLRHLHLLRVPALPGAPRALAPTQAPGPFFFLGGERSAFIYRAVQMQPPMAEGLINC